MEDIPYLGHLVAQTTHTPSRQMIIRRYRPLKEKYLRSFFEAGLYCRSVTKYNDDNEALLGDTVEVSPAMRGAMGAMRGMKARRNAERGIPGPDPDDVVIDDEDLQIDAKEFHRIVRQKFFANCWRIGTGEKERIWKRYIGDEAMTDGFAIETTVGQFVRALPSEPPNGEYQGSASIQSINETDVDDMYAGQSGTDMFVGAVRYQDRQDGAIQPAYYQDAINFYKSKDYDDENEFRFLVNPFDSSNMLVAGQDGKIIREAPNLSEYHRFFPMDTANIVNRIIMAPNAGAKQVETIVSVLDDLEIAHGSGKDEITIVESTLRDGVITETHSYGSEIAGMRIYEDDPDLVREQYEDSVNEFCEQAGEEEWPCIDICQMESPHYGSAIEMYKHISKDPTIDPSDYGYDKLQSICVDRMFSQSSEPKETISYTNEKWDESH